MSTPAITLALIGCGQIGGSLALALKSAGDMRICGYDTTPAHSAALLRMGALDCVAENASEAVKGADIVVLAAPLRSYRAMLGACAEALSPHAIVTDVGSVKRTLADCADLLPSSVTLIGAHPISGSERSGPEAARADLYRDRLCLLTPDDATDPKALAILRTLWEGAGATVREMPVAIHDQLYAYVSHLPHLIAFASAHVFAGMGLRVGPQDETLARYLRISRSSPRMWTDIFLENREALLPSLHLFMGVVEHIAEELRSGEEGSAPAEPLAFAGEILPRLLASALISAVSLYEQQSDVNARAFGAGGMRDIASPAASAPETATEMISHHAAAAAALLASALASLHNIEAPIAAQDEPALFALLSAMQREAKGLVE